MSATTLAAPVVTTGTVGSITTSGGALSGGSVNAESGSVTSIQFCYSTTSLTNCTGGTVSTVAGSNPTASGSGSTSETATLSSLSAGTTYYVNLEGTSAGVTYFGTPTSFTTAAVPTVTNGSAGSITASGATLSGGSVNANNDPNTHTIEYCYSTSALTNCTGGTVSTIAGSNPTASGSSSTAESATLSGLSAGTKYYFNLEATNSAGTVYYGTVANFTTLAAPVVTTGTVGSITTSGGALSGGSVNAESGSVTSIQFCYSTTSLTNCTGGTVSTVAGSNPTASGSGSTSETATLSSLSAGTTYYVNLEGTSAGVTYFGTPTSFTTAAVPTVTNGSAGSITASGATLSGGSVNANNDPNTHTIEYCYSTSALTNCTGGTVSTIAGSNPTASGSSSTAESATLSGLSAGTKYYFNLEATNSAGTVYYGTVANFTTLAAPVVTTGTVGSITTSGGALSGGSVNAESGSVTSIQFCYSTTSLTNCTGGTVSTVAGSNPTASGSGSTSETATLSSLSAGTTYYVNLEGTSAGVTYFGTPTSFTTAAVPTVTNGSAGSITASGATLSGGSVNANNDPNTHTIEYCYSTSALTNCTGGTVSTIAGSNPTASGSSSTAESATLSGLSAGTKYYFNLEATNSAGTVYYGTVANFTTLAAPVVTTGTVGSITTSGAALSGGSVNAESGSVTSIQFCYSTTSLTNCTGGTVSTVAGSNPTASGSGSTSETATLSSLSAGTTYYVNLEGTSAGVTYFGTPTSFTTAAVPTVTNGSAGSITASGATLSGGSVNANNDPNTHTIEYCYSTSALTNCTGGTVSTIAGSNPTASGSSSTAESATLSGLSAGTKYYFNLEATNSAGTVYLRHGGQLHDARRPRGHHGHRGLDHHLGRRALGRERQRRKRLGDLDPVLLLHDLTDQLHRGDRLYRRRLEPHGERLGQHL